MATFFTSDWHFDHNREFIYKSRGFETIDQMNKTIYDNYQETIGANDDVYILGDLTLGSEEFFKEAFPSMYGKIHIIRGNHDTDNRIELYKTYYNVVEVVDAKWTRIGKYHLFLSHGCCPLGTLQSDDLTRMTINLFGHTHQKTNFYNDLPFCYHVGVDSHDCKPVLFEDIIRDLENKMEECKKFL